MISHILIDVDGVLADFITASLRVHGQPNFEVTEWNYFKEMGLSATKFWAGIDAHGAAFWADIEPYPWKDHLLQMAQGVAPFTLATSPSLNPLCAAGKIQWMRKHIEESFHDYMIGTRKQLMARPDVLLIDDSDANVARFMDAGGQAVLFPQPWNENRDLVGDRLKVVRDALKGAKA
jgi:hypothetical protein